jgi:hypothetical protein
MEKEGNEKHGEERLLRRERPTKASQDKIQRPKREQEDTQ